MPLAAETLLLINPAHTGGHDLPSDIVVPEDLLEPLCQAVNDDMLEAYGFFEDDEDDDDDEAGEGDFIDGPEDDLAGALWVWRKPRHRKG